MSVTIVGVDPGGQWTGIAVRHADRLLGHALVARKPAVGARRDRREYGDDVAETVDRLVRRHEADLLAVEDLNDPTPHMGLTSVRGLIDTAWLIGRLDASDVVMVPPAGHGRGLYAEYPPELVSDGERRARGWRLRQAGRSSRLCHVRSAWDVAGAAPRALRLRAEGAVA